MTVVFLLPKRRHNMSKLFENLPDVLDAKALAQALSISKSGAYALLNSPDFPTLQIGGRKLVTKHNLILWMADHTHRMTDAVYRQNVFRNEGSD